MKTKEKYSKYQHVEKLASDEVDGILFGECYVFPKIDGTNAHVWYDGLTMRCGSRNRELSLDNDNAGFMGWAVNNEALWRLITELGEDVHVYGEWLVPHSLKTYRDDAWRRFYVFDVVVGDRHMPYEEYKEICDRVEYDDYLSPLRVIKNPTEEQLYRTLEENRVLIGDGSGVGEGVVIKNYEFVNRFGRQVWAKIVTTEFKEKHVKAMGHPITQGQKHIEEEIVSEYVNSSLVDKVHANIQQDSGGWSSKYIARLLQTVYYDLVREHSWDYVKQHKNPKLDYKTLMRFCNQRTKQLRPDLF